MPRYVPTAVELDGVYHACQSQTLLNLPGGKLIPFLDRVAEGVIPVSVDGPLSDPDNVRSLAMSVALAVLWPVGHWRGAEAREEFRSISNDLVRAWAIREHGAKQQFRKTVDHVVVAGIRRGWPAALEVLTFLLQGNPEKYLPSRRPNADRSDEPLQLPIGPIGASAEYLRGRPVSRSVAGPGESRSNYAGGLIPDLDCCWGGDFLEDTNWAVGAILHRLKQPYAFLQMMAIAPYLRIASSLDGVSFVPEKLLKPLLPGARRNFRLAFGSATLLKNGSHFSYVAEGQRIMLRAFDEGRAQIVLAESRGGVVGGRELDLGSGDIAELKFAPDAGLEAWGCTCGTWGCDCRHRLSGWDPAGAASESLSSFIWNAVKGANRGFNINSFITGMYYALLCGGE